MSERCSSSLRGGAELWKNIPRSARKRMAAHIRGLASRSSTEPLRPRSVLRSIRRVSKSMDWAILRREREVRESAFSVWRESANSAIWRCISGGISSNPIAAILWIVTGCGLVQRGGIKPNQSRCQKARVRGIAQHVGLISRQLYLSQFAIDYEPIRCRSTVVIASFTNAGRLAETMRNHGMRGNLLRTYPRTHPFLFYHTDFIFSLFILLQALYASLPRFSPFVPTRFLPLIIAWSLHLSAFSLAFYFTTYVSLSHTHSLPLVTSHIFPHASRPGPAASLRRASHPRKSQSHIFQVFSEDLGPWSCFVPSVSMHVRPSTGSTPPLSFGVTYVA